MEKRVSLINQYTCVCQDKWFKKQEICTGSHPTEVNEGGECVHCGHIAYYSIKKPKGKKSKKQLTLENGLCYNIDGLRVHLDRIQ